MGQNEEETMGHWGYLGQELWRRAVQPVHSVPFVTYFLLAIIGLGCLGIWVELFELRTADSLPVSNGLLTALVTFYPAMIGSTSLRWIFHSTGEGNKILVSIGLFACVACFLSILYIIGSSQSAVFEKYLVALVASIIAIVLWWLANGDDDAFEQSVPSDTATGGHPDRQLKGGTKNFKVGP